MGRRLAKTLLVDGVIYSAGQEVPDEVAATVTADVWADEPAPTPASPRPARRREPKPKP